MIGPRKQEPDPRDWTDTKAQIEYICSLLAAHVSKDDIEKLFKGWCQNSHFTFRPNEVEWVMETAWAFIESRNRELERMLLSGNGS